MNLSPSICVIRDVDVPTGRARRFALPRIEFVAARSDRAAFPGTTCWPALSNQQTKSASAGTRPAYIATISDT
ncbi:MAG: hypothetical protein OXT71_17670 [Acidobacteriota bacterium]|nr:hypothetical protein [Acidobacteriota bacterium]